MLMDDLLDYRQSQSSTEAFGAEQGFENSRQDFFRNAGPGVLDGKLAKVSYDMRAQCNLSLIVSVVASIGKGLEGIFEEIEHGATHLIGIERQQTVRGAQKQNQPNPFRHRLRFEHLVEPS